MIVQQEEQELDTFFSLPITYYVAQVGILTPGTLKFKKKCFADRRCLYCLHFTFSPYREVLGYREQLLPALSTSSTNHRVSEPTSFLSTCNPQRCFLPMLIILYSKLMCFRISFPCYKQPATYTRLAVFIFESNKCLLRCLCYRICSNLAQVLTIPRLNQTKSLRDVNIFHTTLAIYFSILIKILFTQFMIGSIIVLPKVIIGTIFSHIPPPPPPHPHHNSTPLASFSWVSFYISREGSAPPISRLPALGWLQFPYGLHCKKRLATFPSLAGISLIPNSPWTGII